MGGISPAPRSVSFVETPGTDAPPLEVEGRASERALTGVPSSRGTSLEQRSAERLLRLQAIGAALSDAVTIEAVADAVMANVLGAGGALYALRVTELELIGECGIHPFILEKLRRLPLEGDAPVAIVARSRVPLFAETEAASRDRSPDFSARFGRYVRSEAMAVLPLAVGDRLLGALSFGYAVPRVFDEAERAFLVAFAQQCALALDRARLYELEIHARKAAEEANRLKDEFLSVVSHELRTPLTTILGWVRILGDGPKREAELRRGLDVIERNAKAEVRIVDDILDVGSVITGRLCLSLGEVSLATVVGAARDAVRPAAEAKSIQLYAALASDSVVRGDAARLQQIAWNLLINAIKFTPPGGRVEVAVLRDPSSARIVVRDTGIGMAPDFILYAFERFRQADGSSTRAHGGLGLGLAIVRHFADLHGGSVAAESAGHGRGATFIVTLPLAGRPDDLGIGHTG